MPVDANGQRAGYDAQPRQPLAARLLADRHPHPRVSNLREWPALWHHRPAGRHVDAALARHLSGALGEADVPDGVGLFLGDWSGTVGAW